MNEPNQNVTNEGTENELDQLPPHKGLKFTVGFLGFCIIAMIVLIVAKLIAGDAKSEGAILKDIPSQASGATSQPTPNFVGGETVVEAPAGMTFQRSNVSDGLLQMVFMGEDGRIKIAVVDLSESNNNVRWVEITPAQ